MYDASLNSILDGEQPGNTGCSGKGILIGHIDSGIETSLSAFNGAVREARFFAYNGVFDKDVVSIDKNGHGTMTASIIAGRPTSYWQGGIAQDAQLLVAEAIESGNRLSRILCALIWMLEEPVRIVNLSVGFPGWNPILRPVIRALVEKDVLVVAAIGNGGAGQYHSPGAYPEVLSVGAATEALSVSVASGSLNKNITCIKPDVLGFCSIPFVSLGGKVLSKYTGTSGATAFVSGIVARLMSQFPKASAGNIAEAMKVTALTIDPGHSHRSCKGLIQPLSAAELLPSLKYAVSSPAEPLAFFRDQELCRQLQYLSEKNSVTAILYIKEGLNVKHYINKTLINPETTKFISVSEHLGYAVVVASKGQLSCWWDDQNIIMISSGC